MEKIEIKKLKDQLESILNEFHRGGRTYLDQTAQIIDRELKDLIVSHSNEARNLSIISATVAPFSLTLLSIENLKINAGILIYGFFLLLLNIIFAQFIFRFLLRNQNIKINRVIINSIFADGALQIVGDKTKEQNDRLNEMTEYMKNTDEIEKKLGSKPINLQLLKTNTFLNQTVRIGFILFVAGVMCIILSTVINPIISWLISF